MSVIDYLIEPQECKLWKATIVADADVINRIEDVLQEEMDKDAKNENIVEV